MLFEQGHRVVFIGDSITDCGRRDTYFPLGNGYVSVVAALTAARYPERAIEFVNRGIGGNTVRDLEARWQNDALDERPDWLSVKIGANDVWKTFAREGHPGAVPLDVYEATYRRLLRTVRERSECSVILIEPFLIEPDVDDPMRRRMADYAGVAAALAAEFATVHIRTQDLFDYLLAANVRTNHMLFNTAGPEWGSDRVHPSAAGHAALALAILEAVGW